MLNDNIKKYRQLKDLTQKQLADKVGISGAFMSLIEQGKNKPSEENLKKIAEVLEVSVEDLTIEEFITPTEEILKLLIELTEKEIIKWSIIDDMVDDYEISSEVNGIKYYFEFYTMENINNNISFKDEVIKPCSLNERKLFKKLYDTIMMFQNRDTPIYEAINDLKNLLENEDKED